MPAKREPTNREPALRVVLVTGANRGIGLEVSRQLLRAGYRVVMTGRDRHRTEAAARAEGDNAIAVAMDVADAASIAEASRAVSARVGPVDVLVNNAAILLHEDD